MKKENVVKKVKMFGDAVITYRSKNSRKLKYNVCTLDFDTPYVKSKHNRSTEDADEILLFCWDTDTYRKLKYSQIVSVVALTSLMKGS